MESDDIIEGNITILKEIQKEIKDKEIALIVYQEVCKDRRMMWISKDRQKTSYKGGGFSNEATDKQLKFLRDRNIEHSLDISKSDASALISKALGGGK